VSLKKDHVERGKELPSNVPWCPFQENSYINSDKGRELAIKPHITRKQTYKAKNTKHLFLSKLQFYTVSCELLKL
jgi:hypothetical protein